MGNDPNILRHKVEEGVEVRFMYDGMCAISMLPYDYPNKINHWGIKCKMVNKVKPFLSTTRIIATIGRSVLLTAALDLQEESIWEMNTSIGRNALDIGRIPL